MGFWPLRNDGALSVRTYLVKQYFHQIPGTRYSGKNVQHKYSSSDFDSCCCGALVHITTTVGQVRVTLAGLARPHHLPWTRKWDGRVGAKNTAGRVVRCCVFVPPSTTNSNQTSNSQSGSMCNNTKRLLRLAGFSRAVGSTAFPTTEEENAWKTQCEEHHASAEHSLRIFCSWRAATDRA